MKLFKLELDVCPPSNDCSEYLEMLNNVCTDYKLKIIEFIPFGPAGGNPCITFQGQKENLKKMYVEWYMADGMEAEVAEMEFDEFVR